MPDHKTDICGLDKSTRKDAKMLKGLIHRKKEIKDDALKDHQPCIKKSVCPEPVRANTFPPP